jgi:pimeloyl-ACP methyl ester carboxylesterase
MSAPEARGWNQTSDELLAYHEARLLRHLEAPYTVFAVPLGQQAFIHTLKLEQPTPPSTTSPPIVVIHGFASALATFVNVLRALHTRQHSSDVYAIDLPGFGRSSKPRFADHNQKTEDLLVDSIERWRRQLGIESMILCAHSFGAYLATHYAHRYPAAAAALILFEPWGFQTKPPVQSQWPLDRLNLLRLLRLAGPLGLPLMRLATRDLFGRTFAGIGDADEMLLYLYHSNVQSTGDAAFLSLLGPAYLPIRPATPARRTTIIYGGDSWMGTQAFADGVEVFTETIPDAGHQVYADQFEPFMAAVLRALGRQWHQAN